MPPTAGDLENPEILDAFVKGDGTVSRIEIIGSSGPAADAALRKIADLIRFTPATCGGKPIESETAAVVGGDDVTSPAELAGLPEAGVKGYTRPDCIHCPSPQYPDKALHQEIQGIVVLDVVIGVDGRAHDVTVAKHLERALDQSAVEIIRDTWRYKPANGPDGKPAAVRMMIEIDFHLY